MIIVGGDWNENSGRSSGIVNKLKDIFTSEEVYNGGNLNELPIDKPRGLTIWMPNINNEAPKSYPSKSIGTCLIVSKVVRETKGEHKYTQAVARIFKMNGNAVIAIEKGETGYLFTLIDALGNIWVSTEDLTQLSEKILEFYEWHKEQKRRSVSKDYEVEKFISIVRRNAENVMNNSGTRYFGNCSTRCQKTFPSMRAENSFLFSPRNSDKTYLTVDDMVLILDGKYVGERKPSVDTPVQLELYSYFENINYMIHGHAFYKGVETTEEYYPCGDIREVESVKSKVHANAEFFFINLKNHGYLVGSKSLSALEHFIAFYPPPEMEPFRCYQK